LSKGNNKKFSIDVYLELTGGNLLRLNSNMLDWSGVKVELNK